jgi:hypothetical protein
MQAHHRRAPEHPNPRKAAEGYRLRVLAIEEETAEVVRRIFAEYLDGMGDRAIAHGLNVDGIPCPSANRPDQKRCWTRTTWRPGMWCGSGAPARIASSARAGRHIRRSFLSTLSRKPSSCAGPA